MKKFLKAFSALAMLLTVGLVLSACSSATQKVPQTSEQESAEETAKNTGLKLYHGTFLQSHGVITVPTIAENSGKSDVMFASRNLKLYVDNQKVDILQQKGQPSDFHDTLASESSWNSLVSFYIGSTLNKQQLNECKLVYTTDDGKKVVATSITSDKASQILSDDNSGSDSDTTSLSSYYSNMIEFQEAQTDGDGSKDLESQFNDSKYDNLHTYMVSSTKSPDQALLYINNGTNTDFMLDLSNLEVIDSNGNETLIDPEYRNYSVRLPHGKFTNVLVKFEGKLDRSEAPYTVRLKSKSGDYFDTAKAPYPIQFALNSATTFEDAFVGAPDELNADAVKWSKPKIKGNSFTVKVKLMNYFNIKVDKASDYKLVGVDDDGNEGDKESATDGAPLTIDTSDTVSLRLKFDDLKNLKTYKHIYLYYRNRQLCKVK